MSFERQQKENYSKTCQHVMPSPVKAFAKPQRLTNQKILQQPPPLVIICVFNPKTYDLIPRTTDGFLDGCLMLNFTSSFAYK